MGLSQCCSINLIRVNSKLAVVVVVVLFQQHLVVANSLYSLQQQQQQQQHHPHLPSCHEDDRSALLQFFFNSSSAQHSTCKPADLGQTSNCCLWEGVECDNNTGHVYYLDMIGCNFSGLLPPSLGNLRHLRYLNLSYNEFNGPIPAASLANLTQLIELYLGGNNFSGSIPSSLGNLNKLEVLMLYSNNFSGSIPSSLGNLTQLTELIMFSNQLTGPIPSCLGNLSRLMDLDAGSNNLYGSIPQSLSNLINLKYLYLDNNDLSGTVEFHMMFHRLQNLTFLHLSSNRLELLTDSRVIINDDFPQFEYLGFRSCNVREFPNFLRYQERLVYLDLSVNKMQGLVPNWVLNTSTVNSEIFNISHNFLSGFDQPPTVLPWTTLQILNLSSNMLHGPLPIPPPTMIYYEISDNKFTGEISPLICNMSSLKYLDLSHNKLSGKLPQCLGNISDALQVLNLGNNSFSGILPQTYSNRSILRMIDVSHNQLQGQLPRSLANCESLEFLVLSNNQFNDVFPFWLGTLPQFKLLAMRHNGFHGDMVVKNTKKKWRHFPELHILDLSYNNFTGEFPSEYIFSGNSMRDITHKQSTYMMVKLFVNGSGNSDFEYSITMTNKGVERYFPKINEDFIAIDLSCNKFQGKIPDFIGKLKGLRSLNISNNTLTGPIPHSLSNLTLLESLDLSQNKLSGPIPQQLMQLTFLGKFNVSHNNLTGRIPYRGQLTTFDITSYEGNPGLCGDPLPEKCGNPMAPQLPPPSSAEENDSGSVGILELDWKFVLAGCGSGLVVGVVLADVVITRRQELFLKIVGIMREMITQRSSGGGRRN